VFHAVCGILALSWGLIAACEAADARALKTKKSRQVWVVFFSSRDCPHCESARTLLHALKSKYPVRTKEFDVSRDADYALLRNLETIHSNKKFAVPLVILGESILMGEAEIASNLEKTVRKLSRCGGSPLPYLGRHDNSPPAAAKAPQSAHPPDAAEGRPPTIGEEWKKIRAILDKYF